MTLNNYTIKVLIGASLLILGISSCKSNRKSIRMDNLISVVEFGAKGDGKTDDRPALQRALDSGRDLYFPAGNYNLKSKTEGVSFLVINNKNHSKKLIFHESAWLKIDKNADNEYFKPAVLLLYPKDQPMSGIEIDGLKVDGNRNQQSMTNVGLLLYSDKHLLSNITIKNSEMKDMGGGGYGIYADNVVMENIKTTNCGSHGIGINASYNHIGLVYRYYLNKYTSIDDDAYGIDFSGPTDANAPKETLLNYHFEGYVKNVKVINSLNGIKTAGNWDLTMDSVLIDGSEYNGFFLSKNAPGKTIVANNLIIKNCKGNGLYLAGSSLFKGNHISVENAAVLVQLDKTDVDIKSLTLDGKYSNIATLRMGVSNVKIDGFTIKNNKLNDEYPIWVSGKNVEMKNGTFENMNGIATFIIRNSGDLILENIKESGYAQRNSNFTLGATVDKKSGSITIKNCDFIKKESIRNISNSKINFDR